MTEVFGEFDLESPAPKRFCSRLTTEQFEKQASINTEVALRELVTYLNYNPSAFYSICRKRQQEELETNSTIAFLKSKFWSWLTGESYEEEINLADAQKKLTEFKEDALKAFIYSQDAKGLTRRSSRLLNKKAQLSKANNNCSSDNHLCSNNESSCLKTPLQKTVDNIDKKTSKKLTKIKVAPPLLLLPPPPPPPLPSFQHHLKSLEEIKLYRQGCAHQVSTMNKNHLQKAAVLNGVKENTKDCFNSKSVYSTVLQSIVNGRERLKPCSKQGSQITPRQLRKERIKKTNDGEKFSLFNEVLIDKFKHARGSPLLNSPMSDAGFTP